MDGKFIKGRFIEYGSTVEVLTIKGDVATVRDVKTGVVFDMPAYEEKVIG